MAKHLADRNIGVRAAEELFRRFPNLSEKQITQMLRVERKSLWNWKRGMTPSGYALTALCFMGCDINYILTGRRNNHEEKEA